MPLCWSPPDSDPSRGARAAECTELVSGSRQRHRKIRSNWVVRRRRHLNLPTVPDDLPRPDGTRDLRESVAGRSHGAPNILCTRERLTASPEHGGPLRLIAPGWYGVANVKWLKRIEVMDHRYAGRFMARDYVTFRERTVGGETLWTFTTVSHDLLKSAPAKVTRHDGLYTIIGVAWARRAAVCRSYRRRSVPKPNSGA